MAHAIPKWYLAKKLVTSLGENMKMLIGLMALVLSFSTLASSGETRTFVYDGSVNSVELLLRGEKTHTEYRYEQHRTICYRTITEYRTVCSGGGYTTDRNGRTIPLPRHCYQQPWTRTVSYPCTRTVSIPYEVKDYDVEARVLLDVTNLSEIVTPGEKFKVSLHGDTLSLDIDGSKKFFAMLKKQNVRSNMNGSVKFLDGLYAVELIEAAPVLSALSMTNISIKDNILNVVMGPITANEHLGFSLYVEERRFLRSDIVIFDRELSLSEYAYTTAENSSELSINMNTIGANVSGGKFGITAKAFFKAEGTLLNKNEFPELEASRTLIFTNR
jgi:hypothetical protein